MKQSMLENAKTYIKHKRNLGYVFGTDAWMLRSFGQYADTIARGRPLTVKLALRWATLPNGKKCYHAKRLDALRPFAKFLIVSDSRTELIPTRILGPSFSRTTPYIFSKEEILQLMTVKAYTRTILINNFTFTTVIGLLASTGLRVGEALSLHRKNIDWEQKTIIVKWSKRLPMRLVPLDQTVIDALHQYDQCRSCLFPNTTEETFFLSPEGKANPYQNFQYAWQCLIGKTGIGKGRKHPPRMYDLRHTFACNYLLQSYKNNVNIDAATHTLSVYLGHATVRETYWYLSDVPELMEICSGRFENFVIARRKKGDL